MSHSVHSTLVSAGLRAPVMESYAGQMMLARDMLGMLDCGVLFGCKLTENDRAILRNAYVTAISNAIGFASHA